MSKLTEGEVYRRIKPVDLAPVLPALSGLSFVRVGQTGKYPCDVVLQDKFTPELNALVDGLGLGGYPARKILRKLLPRQNIPVHVDQWMPGELNWRRFQVPLVTHPDIVMRWPDDGAAVYLEPGWLWEVRYDRPHEVIHGADIERIHLQLDWVDAAI